MRSHASINFSYIRIKSLWCVWNFICQISPNVCKKIIEFISYFFASKRSVLLRIILVGSVEDLFLFWWRCKIFSNPRALIALEFNFNFRFWKWIAINVNKDIEKVFICFIGISSFFNVIPISVVQSIFKFVNIFFTVRATTGLWVVLLVLIGKTIGKWSD